MTARCKNQRSRAPLAQCYISNNTYGINVIVFLQSFLSSPKVDGLTPYLVVEFDTQIFCFAIQLTVVGRSMPFFHCWTWVLLFCGLCVQTGYVCVGTEIYDFAHTLSCVDARVTVWLCWPRFAVVHVMKRNYSYCCFFGSLSVVFHHTMFCLPHISGVKPWSLWSWLAAAAGHVHFARNTCSSRSVSHACRASLVVAGYWPLAQECLNVRLLLS